MYGSQRTKGTSLSPGFLSANAGALVQRINKAGCGIVATDGVTSGWGELMSAGGGGKTWHGKRT